MAPKFISQWIHQPKDGLSFLGLTIEGYEQTIFLMPLRFPFFFPAFTAAFLLISGCSSSNSPDGSAGAGGESEVSKVPDNAPAAPGTVVNRIEKTGQLSYKLYLQPEANGGNRKGLILLGAGNDEDDPSTGSLDGALENNVAGELAKLGYVAAIVAYRDQPPLVPNDGGASWNRNSEMLAADMSQVADAVIASVGGGLSRGRVLTGGVSYASFSLLTNVAMNNTPLADTRGLLAACGSTGDYDAKNFKIPIFSLNCSGNPEGDYNGQALIDRIGDPKLKADSGFFTDQACNSHCGGALSTWTAKLVERAQLWLP